MTLALLVIAALLLVAIGVQLTYARAYAAHATRSTKIVWGLNIGLLAMLTLGLIWYALTQGVN